MYKLTIIRAHEIHIFMFFSCFSVPPEAAAGRSLRRWTLRLRRLPWTLLRLPVRTVLGGRLEMPVSTSSQHQDLLRE